MTAINVLLLKDSATVITDAAYYDAQGCVEGFAPKAMVIPSWPGIIAMRGPIYGFARLTAELSLRFPGIDDFAQDAESFMSDFCDRNYEMMTEGLGRISFDIFAVGISATSKKCRGVRVSSRDTDLAEDDEDGLDLYEPFNVEAAEILAPEFMTAPAPDIAALEAAGVTMGMNPNAIDAAAARRLGLQFLGVQRQQTEAFLPGAEPHHFVGGYPCFFTLNKDGTITTSIGKAWPDVIGEPIDPSRDPQPETAPSGGPAHMSRQQRRILEAKQRKLSKGASLTTS